MIVFLTLCYVALLFVLIKIKVLPNSKATWLSTLLFVAILLLFFFIPMQWGAPSGPVSIVSRTVQIIPNVNGQVVEIAVRPNVPVRKGELLFRIDPRPFEIAVDLAAASKARVEAEVKQDQDALAAAEAQLRQAIALQQLAQQRYDDDKVLVASGTISENRLEQREADLEAAIGATEQARAAVSRAETEIGAVTEDGTVAKIAEATAALEQAQWDLEQTSVLAPSDGYVTQLALAEGQRVTNFPFAPAMVFVDTSDKVVVAEIHQIYMRHLKPGQPVEIAFKATPGVLATGTVETILDISSQGQVVASGNLLAAGQMQAEPFFVRIKLDDAKTLEVLKPGSAGTSAIYTESVRPTHLIRKVIIRIESIMNYLVPAL